MYRVQLTQPFLVFQWALPTEFLCHPLYSCIYGTLCPSSRQIVAFLSTLVYLPGPNISLKSCLAFVFLLLLQVLKSTPDTVVTFSGFTGRFSFSTIARACTDNTSHCIDAVIGPAFGRYLTCVHKFCC